MNSNTAILFFSRTAVCEAKHKQFVRDQQRNTAVVAGLIARTRSVVRKSNLPVFWVTEKEQRGQTFGERIYYAARSVIDRGFKQIIIVGNDSPELQLADLRRAKRALNMGQNVVGANRRGGAYLIGLQSEKLTADFQQLPWQQSSFAMALGVFLQHSASTAPLLLRQPTNTTNLRQLRDFNDAKELSVLKIVSKGFRGLRAIFSVVLINFVGTAQNITTRSYRFNFNRRGPPVLG